jgi:hypothetical protein
MVFVNETLTFTHLAGRLQQVNLPWPAVASATHNRNDPYCNVRTVTRERQTPFGTMRVVETVGPEKLPEECHTHMPFSVRWYELLHVSTYLGLVGYTPPTSAFTQVVLDALEELAYELPFPPAFVPDQFSRDAIRGAVTAMVSNELPSLIQTVGSFRIRPRWRAGNSVVVTRRDATAVHVRLALEAAVSGAADVDVDAYFDLRFACQDGTITVTAERYGLNAEGWLIHLFNINNRIGEEIAERLEIPRMELAGLPLCPHLSVDAGANLNLVVGVNEVVDALF